jgi:DMSO/TMAO reductase YedYZ molybdopterin-dependent catalytic subunit
MPDSPRLSPDTQRPQRLPPGQAQTHQFPVLHEGDVPLFDETTWNFTVFPASLAGRMLEWNWSEFQALPRVRVLADMHCVTRWTRLNNLWEGVSTRELLAHLSPSPKATHVMVHAEFGYSSNLRIEDFFADDALFALSHDGRALSADHGFPVRLVVPRLYAWKSVKWVRGIEFLEADRPGYWEQLGYHRRGDPWAEERHAGRE